MLSSPMDQAVTASAEVFTAAMQVVDAAILDALDSRSDYSLVQMAQGLRVNAQVRGLATAKLFAEWQMHCTDFGLALEDWEDHVYQNTGYSHQTIRKYIGAWDAVCAAPEQFVTQLMGKPIESLQLLNAAAREGQLDEDDWREIADAPDKAAIREIVRRARGEATSSGTAITIVADRNGILTAWQAGVPSVVGYLKPEHEIMQEHGKAAVERIFTAAGIQRE